MFLTTGQGGAGSVHAVAVVGGETGPTPQTARKPGPRFDFFVGGKHSVVAFLFCGVIVPVNKRYIIRNLLPDGFFDVGFPGIIIAAGGETEEHVRPHGKGKPVFFTDFGNLFNMFHQNLGAVGVAVQIVVSAAANHMGFVHADVDGAAGKTFGNGGKHAVDEFVYRIVTGQQNIRSVYMGRILRPPHNGV